MCRLPPRRFAWFVLLAIAPPLPAWAAENPVSPDFSRDVRPILEGHCFKCHGPEKQQGGLRLDHRSGISRAGDSGNRPVMAGRPAESELIRRVDSTDPAERMPLDAPPLGREQIATLRAWVERGANWPDSGAAPVLERREMIVTDDDRRHWSYQPLRSVDPPATRVLSGRSFKRKVCAPILRQTRGCSSGASIST